MRPHKELSDESVLLAYAATSDESYFSELYERYWLPLVKYFKKAWPGRPGEDLAQATFLKVVQCKHTYKPGHSVQTWLWTIALRENYDTPDAESYQELTESLVGDESLLSNVDAVDQVEQLLQLLPATQAEAVRNYYLDERHSCRMSRSRGMRLLKNSAVSLLQIRTSQRYNK
jgi:DNA-directed RNA polymerase specialized sigma24 family protein